MVSPPLRLIPPGYQLAYAANGWCLQSYLQIPVLDAMSRAFHSTYPIDIRATHAAPTQAGGLKSLLGLIFLLGARSGLAYSDISAANVRCWATLLRTRCNAGATFQINGTV
jgi:hypothetical protein